MNEHFGADLRLVPYLDRTNSDRDLGNDLFVVEDERRGHDLETLAGVDNLRQALFLRFLTPRGALEHLGHPSYGSRLFTLIGQTNNDANRNRAKLYTLEALAEEPRVERVERIEVETSPARRGEIRVDVSVVTMDGPTPVNLVFGLLLQPGDAT